MRWTLSKIELGTPVYSTIVDPLLVPFGKHKGKNLSTLDDGYLNWCTEQGWILEKHPEFLEQVEFELLQRDARNQEMEDWQLEEYKNMMHEDVFEND
jgi:uncharacterized protein (DUF3820 family)